MEKCKVIAICNHYIVLRLMLSVIPPMRFARGFDEEDSECKKMKLELLRRIMTLHQMGVNQFMVACDYGIGRYLETDASPACGIPSPEALEREMAFREDRTPPEIRRALGLEGGGEVTMSGLVRAVRGELEKAGQSDVFAELERYSASAFAAATSMAADC